MALEEKLKKQDDMVRYRAIEALVQIGPAAAPTVPTLAKFVDKDEDPDNRWHAASAMVTIDPHHRLTHKLTVPLLIAQLKHASPDRRLSSAVYLSYVGKAGKPAVPVLRFGREMQLAGSICHPNLVKVYEIGFHEGRAFLAMEYLQGMTLDALVTKLGRPLLVPQACEYIRQTALALKHCHEVGLIHRDIKPSNLMLLETLPTPVIKVIDLGWRGSLASAISAAAASTGTEGWQTAMTCTSGPR